MTTGDRQYIDAAATHNARQVNVVGEVHAINFPSSDPTLERLRSQIGSAISVQYNALTNRGLLSVPWVQQEGRVDVPRPALNDETALVNFVANGGSLLIFGESQSGKTTLATRLAVELARDDQRLPVMFPLARWPAGRVRLREWMIDVIRGDYGVNDGPGLEVARHALHSGMLVPIFDGFDEIEDSRRAAAVQEIDFFWRGRSAVLTSIPEHNGAGPRAALRYAESIVLAPIAPGEVGRYLRDEARSSDPTQWDDVLRRLTSDAQSPLGIALSSPLMSWLAKSIYDPAESDRPSTAHPGPMELLRTDLATSEAVEEHLLGSLVRSVFPRTALSWRASDSPADIFTVPDAERWLRHLSRYSGVIGFWEIARHAPLNLLAVLPAATIGALLGTAGRIVPLAVAPAFLVIWAGLFFGFGFARGYAIGRATDGEDLGRPGYELDVDQRRRLATSPRRTRQRRRIQKDGDLRYHTRRLVAALPFVAVSYSGCLVAVSIADDQPAWLLGQQPAGFWTGVVLATVAAPTVAFVGALVAAHVLRAKPELDSTTGARAADPLGAIHGDRRSGIGLLVLATITLSVGYLVYDAVALPDEARWGLLAAPMGGLIAMTYWNVWVRYKAAHIWLASFNRLPWRLVTFLRACHNGGILRKRGNYYDFRHQRLRQRLARETPHAW
ncbi:hypothetical protein ACFWD1_31530 [Micromonospora chalcea]